MTTKRLIDPERYKAILLRFEELLTDAGKLEAAEAVRSLIKGLEIAPTVDAVEVVHGQWIEKEYVDEPYGGYYLFHCSECGIPNARERNYCPNCGAKMDGDGNG